jgi:hypothetical protein
MKSKSTHRAQNCTGKMMRRLKALYKRLKKLLNWLYTVITAFVGESDADSVPSTVSVPNEHKYNDDIVHDASASFDEVLAQVGIYRNEQDEVFEPTHEMDLSLEKAVEHKWFRKYDTIKIILNENNMQAMPTTYIKSEKSDRISRVSTHDKTAIVTKAKHFGRTVKLTCAHVVDMMSKAESDQFSSVNPVVFSTKIGSYVPQKVVSRVAIGTIFTTSIDGTSDYIIRVRPLIRFDIPVLYKKHYRMQTVGVLIQFIERHPCIFSGAVMNLDGQLFVLSSGRTTDENLITLVAWNVLRHQIDFELV